MNTLVPLPSILPAPISFTKFSCFNKLSFFIKFPFTRGKEGETRERERKGRERGEREGQTRKREREKQGNFHLKGRGERGGRGREKHERGVKGGNSVVSRERE